MSYVPGTSPSEQQDRPEILAAYKEARARGLPEGWTCTIDKRKRRKWTAPNNGRSCDSIPKAIAISVDLGLLPPDTPIPSGSQKKRKRSASAKKPGRKKAVVADSVASSGENQYVSAEKNLEATEDDDLDTPKHQQQPDRPSELLDPEHALDGHRRTVLPKTVHWDPTSPDGSKVGWKIHIAYGPDKWAVGRILRYDPHSHKHKLLLLPNHTDEEQLAAAVSEDTAPSVDSTTTCWIWIRNQQHNLQVATRLVWAHVKGYAWWPALVMETNESQARRTGFVQVEFFGSGEVSTLRDSPDCIRPFSPYEVDPVVAKHKKKRNTRAFHLACREFHAIRQTRNRAALFYAEKAIVLAQKMGNSASSTGTAKNLVGKRVEVFRSNLNYPYGAHVAGYVRKFSVAQKKWLVSFDKSSLSTNNSGGSTRTSLMAATHATWLNLHSKELQLKVKKNPASIHNDDLRDETLIPFLVGFEGEESKDTEGGGYVLKRESRVIKLLRTRCKGCVEPLEGGKDNQQSVTCDTCSSVFHLGCLDPPLALETWQQMMRNGTRFVCSQCTPCRGCYQRDIVFGSHTCPTPEMLSFSPSDSLDLCSTCRQAYQDRRFCPNCAHSWDDKKLQEVVQQLEWTAATFTRRGRKKKGIMADCMIEDTELPLSLGFFSGEDVLPVGAKVKPVNFYPETSNWGYTEVDMLVCDKCGLWVHAGCAGLSEEEYDATSEGNHPVYSKEFLCRMCCRARVKEIISELQKQDVSLLFAAPVSDLVAPNYHDIIRDPMDLQTMLQKAEDEEYLNYAWVRDMFELMVLNACTFNRHYTRVWNEARRFYNTALKTVFSKIGKAAPPGEYHEAIKKNFAAAEDARKKEVDRVQVDESVEKKDLVAGSLAASVSQPKLREAPPDQKSCVPCHEIEMGSVDAFYASWMEACFCCGTSGAADTMLFCVDCGEAFHSFCANAPIHSMDLFSVTGWRCPNCKVDEITGDVPADETKMLFCEKCDRGFCTDQLEPPLSRAPPGLWICGQCVDCELCGNTREPSGVSLRYWSRFPDKCYRCGGCEGLEEVPLSRRCQVCTCPLRDGDDDVVSCDLCDDPVHGKCDSRALRHLQPSAMDGKYTCPRCHKKIEHEECDGNPGGREKLLELAVHSLTSNTLPVNDCPGALLQDLIASMDWSVRNMWRDQYLSVVRDGLRLLSKIRRELGDPRAGVEKAEAVSSHFPSWKIHRSNRFVAYVRQKRLEEKGCYVEGIETAVLLAKMSAAFIEVSCGALEVDVAAHVDCHRKVTQLVQDPPPGGETLGIFRLPADTLRTIELPIDLEASRFWSTERDTAGSIKRVPTDNRSESERQAKAKGDTPTARHTPCIAVPSAPVKPLCGWNEQIPGGHNQSVWKDPRECCLCHVCGDDDAGYLEDEAMGGLDFTSGLGRLLPMPDGYWAHTSCALWSSEVWEAPSDGLVHSVEKARSRGAQLKCFGCGLSGATVGCNKGNCPFNYHFACAKACGAVFTADQRVFCANHRSSATSTLSKDSFEHMKTLLIEPEKKNQVLSEKDSMSDSLATDVAVRVGALTVHSLGQISRTSDGFHSEDYITPEGYVATRIFWSARTPRQRTLYVMKIQKSAVGEAQFLILPADDPTNALQGDSVSALYKELTERVRATNTAFFSRCDMSSRLPATRRTRKKAFGLNGAQFFGFGTDPIRRRLEGSPGSEALVAPLTRHSPRYRFCFVQPSTDAILALQRLRAAKSAEEALENTSGCARTEGIKAVARSGGSGRITRALVRSAEEDVVSTGNPTKKQEDKAKADRNLSQVKYRRMKAIPIEDRLVARRSHIHGWGLFTKRDICRHDPIVEYMGEIIRQSVGDRREKMYEVSGEGSCYMFRLDRHRIVDATMIGCMARFMNHSCQPNAYAKIITVDTDGGSSERKIVVFANRDISSGEEITYDYKFPVEDGSLRCMCGAPNCIGRLN